MQKVLFLLGMILSFSASASDATTGIVTGIGGQMVGTKSLYFGLSSEPQNRPDCSTDGGYFYVFDPSTDDGKALYSALLSAKALGADIKVKGAGNCILGQPMESISYWTLKP